MRTMERIDKPLLEVWRELAAMYEAREINRATLREGLEHRTFDAWPDLAEHHRETLRACGTPEPGADLEVLPEGLSVGAEGLWRLRHLKRLGCPRGDLEGLIGLFCSITGLDFAEVAAFIFGGEALLNVNA